MAQDSGHDLLQLLETDTSQITNNVENDIKAVTVLENIPIQDVDILPNQRTTKRRSSALESEDMIEPDVDLLQVLDDNVVSKRPSKRRSSFLKINDFRRNSRRVSWAKTFQCSDGTTVVTSQELNKYGLDPHRKSAELKFSKTNENVAPNLQTPKIVDSPSSSIVASCSAEKPLITDPAQEEANMKVMQKVKSKVQNPKKYTRILSEYYDKEDKKDMETVVNTAVNRLGIDIDLTTADLNSKFDPIKELVTENENLNDFLKQFAQQQQVSKIKQLLRVEQSQQPIEPANMSVVSAKSGDIMSSSISPISSEKQNSIDINCSTLDGNSFICNSTKINQTYAPFLQEFWKSTKNVEETSGDKNEEEEEKSIHDTTMIRADSSSGSDCSIEVIAPPQNSVSKTEINFVDMIKKDSFNDDKLSSPMTNSDTFEFPSKNTKETTAVEEDMQTICKTTMIEIDSSDNSGKIEIDGAIERETEVNFVDFLKGDASNRDDSTLSPASSDTFELSFQAVVDEKKVIENSQKENEPFGPIDDSGESVVVEDILNNNNNERDITLTSATVVETEPMSFSDTKLSIAPQPLDGTEDVAMKRVLKVASPSFEVFQDPSMTMIKSCAITNDDNIDNDLPVLSQKENDPCLPRLPVSTVSPTDDFNLTTTNTQQADHPFIPKIFLDEDNTRDVFMDKSVCPDSQKENQPAPFIGSASLFEGPLQNQSCESRGELTSLSNTTFSRIASETATQFDISMAATNKLELLDDLNGNLPGEASHCNMQMDTSATFADLLASPSQLDISDDQQQEPKFDLDESSLIMEIRKHAKSIDDSPMMSSKVVNLEMSSVIFDVPTKTPFTCTKNLLDILDGENRKITVEGVEEVCDQPALDLPSITEDDNGSIRSTQDINVEIFEITKNMDTNVLTTEDEGLKVPYAPTKPILGKSASTILDQEMEFLESSVAGSVDAVLNSGISSASTQDNHNLKAIDGQTASDCGETIKLQENVNKLLIGESKEIVPPQQEPKESIVSREEPAPATVSSLSTISPTGKRPYNFTILNMPQFSEKIAKRNETKNETNYNGQPKNYDNISMIGNQTTKITPVAQQTSFSTNNFSFSQPNYMSTTISRIPIRSNCGLAFSSATKLRAPLPPICPPNSSTTLLRSGTEISQAVSSTALYSNSSTRIAYSTASTAQSSSVCTNSIATKTKATTQIELDFNRSRNSKNNSNIFDASLNKSGDHSRNDELSFSNENMSCNFARKHLRITLGYDLKERLKLKTALLNEQREKDDQLKQQETVSSLTVDALMPNENENGACEENYEIGGEIVGKENHFDFPNISIPNISIETLDELSDEFEDSDGDVQQLSQINEENLSMVLDPIKETVSRPILSLEASPSATASHNGLTQPLLEKTFCDLNFTLYNNMSNEDSSISEYETQPLDKLKSFANNDALYHSLEKLDFNALKLRIYSMKPHECVIRFLWGTVEVRINFYEVFSSTGVRRMEFNVVSLLKSDQPISEQVLRDTDLPDSELSLYNGDHQPCIIDEKDRPILQIGHKYILTHFDEKYPQLHKDYPDSSKLLELIHELSQTANIARSMVTELLYIYKSSVVELLPPDGERFRFNLTLLGEPLGSEFDLVFSFDPLNYPYEVIHPTIVVPDKYQHIYPLDQFKAAFLSENPGENFLKRLIKVAKVFVRAIRYVRNKNRRLEKQKLQIAAATLPPPTPPTNNATD